jgi:hypothetical protein
VDRNKSPSINGGNFAAFNVQKTVANHQHEEGISMKRNNNEDMDETTTEERLENGIKNQPERYMETRDSGGRLIEVLDKDSGRLWKRMSDGTWMWIT